MTLLLNPGVDSSGRYAPFEYYPPGNPLAGAASSTPLYGVIEELLVRGRREEAVQIALQHKDWGLALLIGGNCRVEVYQEIVREFADEAFPTGSPLHFISLLYSNQADRAVRFGGKKFGEAGNSSGARGEFAESWKTKFASILSNKTGAWAELAEGIADRLLVDARDVHAAHFALLCAGALPAAPGAGKLTLLGYDDSPQNIMRHLGSGDPACVQAFRMTEILEFSIRCTDKSRPKPPTPPQPSAGFSFTGLFGTKTQSSLNNDSMPVHVGHSEGVVSVTEIVSVIHSLCPLKLKFAMMISDLGMTKEASEYVVAIRRTIAEIPNLLKGRGSADDPKPGKSLSKKFLRDLDDFSDRLCSSSGPSRAEAAQQHIAPAAPASTAFFGLTNMMTAIQSSSALKSLVDGDDTQHPKPSQTVPILVDLVGRTSANGAFPPAQLQAPTSQSFVQSSNAMDLPPMPPGVSFARRPPVPQHPPVTSAPPQPQSLSPQQLMSFGVLPAQSRGDPNAGGPPAGYGERGGVSTTSAFDDASQPAKQQNEPLVDAKSSDGGLADANKGIVSTVKKGLLKWLYPDAHDATENLGDENKAYFDSKLNRWIFPGQENDEVDVSMAPPPTLPSLPSSQSLSGFQTSATTSRGGGSYDPLEALMAPRPVSYSALQASPSANTLQAADSGNYDPLAALMAPRNHSFGAFQALSAQPSSAVKAPPVNMWTPPPIAPSASATTLPIDGLIPSSTPQSSQSEAGREQIEMMDVVESLPAATWVPNEQATEENIVTDNPSSFYINSQINSSFASNFIEDF